jgi:hypothetical protein
VTLTATQSVTLTASPTPSGTRTVTLTATESITQTQTSTITLTPTRSITHTISPTITPTPSITPTATISPVRFYDQPNLIDLHALYPNPMRDTGKIFFSLREDAKAVMLVYNVAGETVRVIQLDGKKGKNVLIWQGDNNYGQSVASGYYIIKLKANGVSGLQDQVWARLVVAR